MKKVFLLLIFTLSLCATCLAQNQTYSDTFTITTYYPAPYGVYQNMRIYPSADPTGKPGIEEGAIYYDQNLHMMRYLNNTTWVNVTGSSSGGYWTQSGTNIYNNNTGNVGIGTNIPSRKLEVNGSGLFTGDVCNGAGKCLNESLQTNVMVGTNPTCPAGQTIIMKAYGGTWYTPDNSAITSWNKVTCGQQLSSDGTAFLYNSAHTSKSCTDLSGAVFATDTPGVVICRLGGANCPGGWTWYPSYTATGSGVFCPTQGLNDGHYMPYHNFSNNAAMESMTVWKCMNSAHSYSGCGCNNVYPCTCDCSGGTYGHNSCTNSRVQVGCY